MRRPSREGTHAAPVAYSRLRDGWGQPNTRVLLSQLLRATETMTRELEPARVYDSVVRVVQEVTGAERVSLQVPDESSQQLILKAGLGLPPGVRVGQASSPDRSVAGWVFAHRRPLLLLGRTHPDPGVQTLLRRRRGHTRLPASALCVPLVVDERPLGLLNASKGDPRHSFDTTDLDFLATLARQAAIAIENAHLYEAERDAHAKSEALNRAKDELVAAVSHDLRTPLTAILGWAQLLRAKELDHPAAARALEGIERGARSQAQLIADLLDTSSIVTGKLRLEPHPVDLAAVIEHAVETVRPAAADKGVALCTALEPSAIPVTGDPDRLQQILWNLLCNAVKFTPAGGRVDVRLTCTECRAEITVSDTGRGISAEFLPYVFDRFRQAENVSTHAPGSLGLGLAIVRQLVELHGGTVHAASEGEGKGAAFTVMLPLVAPR